mmetsp:Transcript_10263/g.19730  ORF Transcript_10263/g.19730 Transcript_10263/m.19730 type:complete len:289 (-) Transcript_10263:636-1502(-)
MENEITVCHPRRELEGCPAEEKPLLFGSGFAWALRLKMLLRRREAAFFLALDEHRVHDLHVFLPVDVLLPKPLERLYIRLHKTHPLDYREGAVLVSSNRHLHPIHVHRLFKLRRQCREETLDHFLTLFLQHPGHGESTATPLSTQIVVVLLLLLRLSLRLSQLELLHPLPHPRGRRSRGVLQLQIRLRERTARRRGFRSHGSGFRPGPCSPWPQGSWSGDRGCGGRGWSGFRGRRRLGFRGRRFLNGFRSGGRDVCVGGLGVLRLLRDFILRPAKGRHVLAKSLEVVA